MGKNKEQTAYEKLSPKWRLFVDAYFNCKRNATKAAIEAGYSERNARQQGSLMLTYADITAAVDERSAEIAKKAEIDIAWVLKKQVEVIDRCMQHEAVYDNEGELIGEYKFDSSGANTGIKTIAKYLGMDKSTVDVVAAGMGLVLHLTGKPDEADD